MLPSYFDYIFVHLRQKVLFRPEIFVNFRPESEPKSPARLTTLEVARQEPMVQISVLVHRFRDEDQNKRKSSSRNLRLRCNVHPCFCPRTRVYSRLEGLKQYFWGMAQALKSTLEAPGLLFCFGAQSSLGGGTFLAWGAQAVIWGHGSEMSPVAPGLCLPHTAEVLHGSFNC